MGRTHSDCANWDCFNWQCKAQPGEPRPFWMRGDRCRSGWLNPDEGSMECATFRPRELEPEGDDGNP